MTSLEEVLDALAGCLTYGRQVLWTQADLCAKGLTFGKVAGKLAEVAGCSRAKITSLARAANAFPFDADRYPDVPFSIYVLAASSPKARSMFQQAIAEEWSVRQYKEALAGVPSQPRERCQTCNRPL